MQPRRIQPLPAVNILRQTPKSPTPTRTSLTKEIGHTVPSITKSALPGMTAKSIPRQKQKRLLTNIQKNNLSSALVKLHLSWQPGRSARPVLVYWKCRNAEAPDYSVPPSERRFGRPRNGKTDWFFLYVSGNWSLLAISSFGLLPRCLSWK